MSATSEAIVCGGYAAVVPLSTERDRIKGEIARIADSVDQ